MSHNALAAKEAMNGAPSIPDRNECQEKKERPEIGHKFWAHQNLFDNIAYK
jgi:hypothetical protein